MNSYRIKKLTYSNGTDEYIIQKKSRIFFIGPKIWKTYSQDWDEFGGGLSWNWFSCWGDGFATLKQAQEKLDWIRSRRSEINIVKTGVVYETEC
jgi:hypothetical protein